MSKLTRLRRGLWVAVTVLVCLVAVMAVMRPKPAHEAPAAFAREGVAVGGPFTLIDQRGREVKERDFRGQWMLVYFGFTSCPDVCPTDLLQMTRLMELLGEEGEALTPIFISVDPERDTPEQLAAFASNFTPRLVALTGSAESVKEAMRSFKVYAARHDEPSSALGYTMDHSAFLYLMDKEGKYYAHFPHGASAEDMARVVRPALAQ